jgi:Chitobiase/beta-hexosaminidase C-terminal domain
MRFVKRLGYLFAITAIMAVVANAGAQNGLTQGPTAIPESSTVTYFQPLVVTVSGPDTNAAIYYALGVGTVSQPLSFQLLTGSTIVIPYGNGQHGSTTLNLKALTPGKYESPVVSYKYRFKLPKPAVAPVFNVGSFYFHITDALNVPQNQVIWNGYHSATYVAMLKFAIVDPDGLSVPENTGQLDGGGLPIPTYQSYMVANTVTENGPLLTKAGAYQITAYGGWPDDPYEPSEVVTLTVEGTQSPTIVPTTTVLSGSNLVVSATPADPGDNVYYTTDISAPYQVMAGNTFTVSGGSVSLWVLAQAPGKGPSPVSTNIYSTKVPTPTVGVEFKGRNFWFNMATALVIPDDRLYAGTRYENVYVPAAPLFVVKHRVGFIITDPDGADLWFGNSYIYDDGGGYYQSTYTFQSWDSGDTFPGKTFEAGPVLSKPGTYHVRAFTPAGTGIVPWVDSDSVAVTVPSAAVPTITPSSGFITNAGTSVTVTPGTPGDLIYYNGDKSDHYQLMTGNTVTLPYVPVELRVYAQGSTNAPSVTVTNNYRTKCPVPTAVVHLDNGRLYFDISASLAIPDFTFCSATEYSVLANDYLPYWGIAHYVQFRITDPDGLVIPFQSGVDAHSAPVYNFQNYTTATGLTTEKGPLLTKAGTYQIQTVVRSDWGQFFSYWAQYMDSDPLAVSISNTLPPTVEPASGTWNVTNAIMLTATPANAGDIIYYKQHASTNYTLMSGNQVVLPGWGANIDIVAQAPGSVPSSVVNRVYTAQYPQPTVEFHHVDRGFYFTLVDPIHFPDSTLVSQRYFYFSSDTPYWFYPPEADGFFTNTIHWVQFNITDPRGRTTPFVTMHRIDARPYPHDEFLYNFQNYQVTDTATIEDTPIFSTPGVYQFSVETISPAFRPDMPADQLLVAADAWLPSDVVSFNVTPSETPAVFPASGYITNFQPISVSVTTSNSADTIFFSADDAPYQVMTNRQATLPYSSHKLAVFSQTPGQSPSIVVTNIYTAKLPAPGLWFQTNDTLTVTSATAGQFNITGPVAVSWASQNGTNAVSQPLGLVPGAAGDYAVWQSQTNWLDSDTVHTNIAQTAAPGVTPPDESISNMAPVAVSVTPANGGDRIYWSLDAGTNYMLATNNPLVLAYGSYDLRFYAIADGQLASPAVARRFTAKLGPPSAQGQPDGSLLVTSPYRGEFSVSGPFGPVGGGTAVWNEQQERWISDPVPGPGDYTITQAADGWSASDATVVHIVLPQIAGIPAPGDYHNPILITPTSTTEGVNVNYRVDGLTGAGTNDLNGVYDIYTYNARQGIWKSGNQPFTLDGNYPGAGACLLHIAAQGTNVFPLVTNCLISFSVAPLVTVPDSANVPICSGSTQVVVSCATTNAIVEYDLGTEQFIQVSYFFSQLQIWDLGWPRYTGPIGIAQRTYLTLAASKTNYNNSSIKQMSFVCTEPQTFQFTPGPGQYTNPITAQLTYSYPGAALYYRLDGPYPVVRNQYGDLVTEGGDDPYLYYAGNRTYHNRNNQPWLGLYFAGPEAVFHTLTSYGDAGWYATYEETMGFGSSYDNFFGYWHKYSGPFTIYGNFNYFRGGNTPTNCTLHVYSDGGQYLAPFATNFLITFDSKPFSLDLGFVPQPRNDNWAAALPIAAGRTYNGYSLAATTEPGEAAGTRTTWWKLWVPTGVLIVDSTNNLDIWQGNSLDTLQPITKVDTSGLLPSLVLDTHHPYVGAQEEGVLVTADDLIYPPYYTVTNGLCYIRMSDNQPTYTLAVNSIVAPPNDNFANATEVPLAAQVIGAIVQGKGSADLGNELIATYDVSGSSLASTFETGEPAGAQGAGSVWYHWRAPTDGSISWSVSPAVQFDVYTGPDATTINDLVPVANDIPGRYRLEAIPTGELPGAAVGLTSGAVGREVMPTVNPTYYRSPVNGWIDIWSQELIVISGMATYQDPRYDKLVQATVPLITGAPRLAGFDYTAQDHFGVHSIYVSAGEYFSMDPVPVPNSSVGVYSSPPGNSDNGIPADYINMSLSIRNYGIATSNTTWISQSATMIRARASYTADVTAGRDYFLRVSGIGCQHRITGYFTGVPSNDGVLQAETIGLALRQYANGLQGEALASGTTMGSRKEAFETNTPNQYTTWYRFISPVTGQAWALDIPLTPTFEWQDPYDGVGHTWRMVQETPPQYAFFSGADTNQLTPIGNGTATVTNQGTYYLQVSTDYEKAYKFKLQAIEPPHNDYFTNNLTIEAATLSAYNTLATVELNEPISTNSQLAASVWWNYMPLLDGSVNFTVSSGQRLYLFQGTALDNLQPIGNGTNLTIEVLHGQQYVVEVNTPTNSGTPVWVLPSHGEFSGSYVTPTSTNVPGTFTLTTMAYPKSTNDNFANAIPLTDWASHDYDNGTVFYGQAAGYTYGASLEPGETGAGSNSVWYVWQATDVMDIYPAIVSSEFEAHDTVESYQGTSLTNLQMLPAKFTSELGKSYYFRVSGNDPRFQLAVRAVTAPNNDMIDNALSVNTLGDSKMMFNYSATGEGFEQSTYNNSIWVVWAGLVMTNCSFTVIPHPETTNNIPRELVIYSSQKEFIASYTFPPDQTVISFPLTSKGQILYISYSSPDGELVSFVVNSPPGTIPQDEIATAKWWEWVEPDTALQADNFNILKGVAGVSSGMNCREFRCGPQVSIEFQLPYMFRLSAPAAGLVLDQNYLPALADTQWIVQNQVTNDLADSFLASGGPNEFLIFENRVQHWYVLETPPINDVRQTALDITDWPRTPDAAGGYVVNFWSGNLSAHTEGDALLNSVWYKFELPKRGVLQVQSGAANLHLLPTDAGAFSSIASAHLTGVNTTIPAGETMDINVEAGSYYLVQSDQATPSTGQHIIYWTAAINDNFVNAFEATNWVATAYRNGSIYAVSYAGNVDGASVEPDEPNALSNHTLWSTAVAPADGLVYVMAHDSVFTGDGTMAGLQLLHAARANPGADSFWVQSGTRLWIQCSDLPAIPRLLNLVQLPSNDNFNAAIDLNVNNGVITNLNGQQVYLFTFQAPAGFWSSLADGNDGQGPHFLRNWYKIQGTTNLLDVLVSQPDTAGGYYDFGSSGDSELFCQNGCADSTSPKFVRYTTTSQHYFYPQVWGKTPYDINVPQTWVYFGSRYLSNQTNNNAYRGLFDMSAFPTGEGISYLYAVPQNIQFGSVASAIDPTNSGAAGASRPITYTFVLARPDTITLTPVFPCDAPQTINVTAQTMNQGLIAYDMGATFESQEPAQVAAQGSVWWKLRMPFTGWLTVTSSIPYTTANIPTASPPLIYVWRGTNLNNLEPLGDTYAPGQKPGGTSVQVNGGDSIAISTDISGSPSLFTLSIQEWAQGSTTPGTANTINPNWQRVYENGQLWGYDYDYHIPENESNIWFAFTPPASGWLLRQPADNAIATLFQPVAADLKILPPGGGFAASTLVEITANLDNLGPMVVHYTLDGTDPSTNSPLYSGAILLTNSATVKALGTRTGRSDQRIAAAFTVYPPVIISAPTNEQTGPFVLALSNTDTNFSLFYRVTGGAWQAYSNSVVIDGAGSGDAYIYFKGVVNGQVVYTASIPVTFTAPPPEIWPLTATFGTNSSLTIAAGTNSIYYTMLTLNSRVAGDYAANAALPGNVERSGTFQSQWTLPAGNYLIKFQTQKAGYQLSDIVLGSYNK